MNDNQQTSLKLSSLSSDASASAIGQEPVSKFQASVPSLRWRGSVSVADQTEGQKSPGGAGFKYHLLSQHRVSFCFFENATTTDKGFGGNKMMLATLEMSQ